MTSIAPPPHRCRRRGCLKVEKSRKRAPGHAAHGASEDHPGTPVQLATGLSRTRQVPTSVPTAALQYQSLAIRHQFHPGGSTAGGRGGTRNDASEVSMMIDVIGVRRLGGFKLELEFSDG